MSWSIRSMVNHANQGRVGDGDWRHLRHDVAHTASMVVVSILPVVAAGFAIPQFIPQILKLRRTGDTAGLSTAWALLTGIHNTAWFGYFAASRYWFALLPSSSAALLGGGLGVMLGRRRPLGRRARILIGAWTTVLAGAAIVDRRLLGAILTAAFLVQVVPAVVTAYRARRSTGIARGTWRLILGEVSCWAVFGAAQRDGPLVVLGITGVISALLMLHRSRRGDVCDEGTQAPDAKAVDELAVGGDQSGDAGELLVDR
jgi:hypothetical protein